MKKIILSSMLFVTLSVMFSSCTQDCYLCKTSGDSTTICKEDYASTKEYNDALKKIKALGFTCK